MDAAIVKDGDAAFMAASAAPSDWSNDALMAEKDMAALQLHFLKSACHAPSTRRSSVLSTSEPALSPVSAGPRTAARSSSEDKERNRTGSNARARPTEALSSPRAGENSKGADRRNGRRGGGRDEGGNRGTSGRGGGDAGSRTKSGRVAKARPTHTQSDAQSAPSSQAVGASSTSAAAETETAASDLKPRAFPEEPVELEASEGSDIFDELMT